MLLRRELLMTIGSLVLINVLFAFGAIGLFVRMGPVFERISRDNVFSIVAGETMLIELAKMGDTGLQGNSRERVLDALQAARNNITEEAERPVILAMEAHLNATIEGDPQARQEMVFQLQELLRINRIAMDRIGMEAEQQGWAGAWAAVLVGFFSFVMSLVVVVRLRKRLLGPLEELYGVLDSVRHGDRFRRCRAQDAPFEVRQVAEAVNILLDERISDHLIHLNKREHLERLALREMLERHEEGCAVVNNRGEIVHASQRMLERLSADKGELLHGRITQERNADGYVEIIPLDGGAGRLCILHGSFAGG